MLHNCACVWPISMDRKFAVESVLFGHECLLTLCSETSTVHHHQCPPLPGSRNSLLETLHTQRLWAQFQHGWHSLSKPGAAALSSDLRVSDQSNVSERSVSMGSSDIGQNLGSSVRHTVGAGMRLLRSVNIWV